MAHGPKGAYSRLQKYIGRLIATGRASKDANPLHAAALLLGSLFSDVMGRDMMPEALPAAKQAPAAYVELVLRAVGYTARPSTSRRRPATARTRRPA
jgi:hypothetical protein